MRIKKIWQILNEDDGLPELTYMDGVKLCFQGICIGAVSVIYGVILLVAAGAS